MVFWHGLFCCCHIGICICILLKELRFLVWGRWTLEGGRREGIVRDVTERSKGVKAGNARNINNCYLISFHFGMDFNCNLGFYFHYFFLYLKFPNLTSSHLCDYLPHSPHGTKLIGTFLSSGQSNSGPKSNRSYSP